MDQGDVQIAHSLEHGLIQVRVRQPLGVTYAEVVMPVDQFFAMVGETLHKTMAAHAAAREALGRDGVRVAPGRPALVTA